MADHGGRRRDIDDLDGLGDIGKLQASLTATRMKSWL
jgi:hypothetical protein